MIPSRVVSGAFTRCMCWAPYIHNLLEFHLKPYKVRIHFFVPVHFVAAGLRVRVAFLPAALRLLPLGRLIPRDQLAAALFPAGWVSAPSGHSPGLALLLPPLLFLVPCLSYGLPGSNLTLAGPSSEKLTRIHVCS